MSSNKLCHSTRNTSRSPQIRALENTAPGLCLAGLVTLLVLSAPTAADTASCTTATGNIANCTGDQSAIVEAGVDFPTSTTVLNINNLNNDFGGLRWIPSAGGSQPLSTRIAIDTFVYDMTGQVNVQLTGAGTPGAVTDPSLLTQYVMNVRTPRSTFEAQSLLFIGDGRNNDGKTFYTGALQTLVFEKSTAADGSQQWHGPIGMIANGGIGGDSSVNGVTAGYAGSLVIDTNTAVSVTSSNSGQNAVTLRSAGGSVQGTDTSSRAGKGGEIQVNSSSGSWSITTAGDGATGIHISSEGGGFEFPNASPVGAGGHGGQVSIDGATIEVTTTGDHADGIVATSQGIASRSNVAGMPGGSGDQVTLNGIFSIATSGQASDGVAATSLGGAGGPGSGGGDGGDIFFDALAGSTLSTAGDLAAGVAAQSIGGRGGNAAYSGGLVTFAADGGASGRPGAVSLTNQGIVTTGGDQATAMIAQSIGGSGGHGGSAFGLFYSDGGAGGAGGDGGTVSVTSGADSVLSTDGHASSGMVAQSIGGTGGSGGGVGGLAAVGGGNGSAGSADTVIVTNRGSIETGRNAGGMASDDAACPFGCSYGMLAQSIGGGGGNGGSAKGLFSLGGQGGGGGAGGDVTASNTGGSVTTHLDDSTAVLGQSLGGGGGNGGASISAGVIGSVAIGGSGGAGGAAGTVALNHTAGGSLETFGDRSHGMHGQSVGGGGGTGAYAVDVSGSAVVPAVAIAVGGTGGSGGKGNDVYLTDIDTGAGNRVTTHGDYAHGQYAQSIGGGGGHGGTAISAAAGGGGPLGAVSVSVGGSGGSGLDAGLSTIISEGNVTTHGFHSSGLIAQSVGGGGGGGGLSVAGTIGVADKGTIGVSAGGGAGQGGNGDNVTVTSTGAVTTAGDMATAIVAQSFGGGGGNGGGAIAAGAQLSGASAEVNVAVGGASGTGGLAGASTISVAGDVTTSGSQSDGLLAQSIGGGGGNGGFAVAGSLNLSSSHSAQVAVGGAGGSAGSASQVTATTQAGSTVATTGNGSRGIVAQSIGGGGGNGGMAVTGTVGVASGKTMNLDLSVGGTGGTGGTGNNVQVTHRGSLVTGPGTVADPGDSDAAIDQAGGHGILAQSIGGGGGSGGLAASGSLERGNRVAKINIGGAGGSGDHANLAVVDSYGSVTTSGVQSDGIVAQTIGGGGGNAHGTFSAGAQTKETRSVALSIGGEGGSGGRGGTASVELYSGAAVNANGLGSRGVVVQSIGGGGGNGGSNTFYSNKLAGANDTARIGIGGRAGSGAQAGWGQFFMDDSTIVTGNGVANPDDAGTAYEGHGVLVQSIGGGGGSGGIGISGNTKTAGDSGSLTVGVGGGAPQSGSPAPNEGNRVYVGAYRDGSDNIVDKRLTGSIATTNYRSHGIFAQTIGGGGGIGNAGISGDVTNTTKYGLVAGIGGRGGAGNDAGDEVLVYNGASVNASGAGSRGLMVQSVGGGGGAGGAGIHGDVTSSANDDGSKQLDVGLGNAGGSGGYGGYVGINNSGSITTGTNAVAGAYANRMDGIFAQSVGGGGGSSGSGIVGNLDSKGKSSNLELNLGISLDAGSAGGGGQVDVFNSGNLTTHGDNSRGIVAQSLGGGGGDAHVGIDGGLSTADSSGTTADTQVALGFGRQGGAGGNAGRATVTNQGKVAVLGYANGTAASGLTGILVQSIGGGGGNGGAGISGDVTGAKNTKAATIAIGGAGGSGGDAACSNGATGDSCPTEAGVVINNSGMVEVVGDAGRGLHGQSIGGGGGNAALGIDGKVNSGDGKAITFALGLSGGAGGDGGSVEVNNSGSVITGAAAGMNTGTLGDGHGMLVQSVGGGGGTGVVTGGLVYGSTGGSFDRGIDFALGAKSGGTSNAGGNGGSAVAVNAGSVETFYAGSHGVFIQSVGGGGGHVGNLGGIGTDDANETWAATLAIGSDAGSTGSTAGDGGAVSAVMNNASATITTHSSGSHGILAQSIGGGGGDAGNAAGGGTGNAKIGVTLGAVGAVTGNGGQVVVSGDAGDPTKAALGSITTSGSYAIGVLAQSIGGGGGAGGVGLSAAEGSFVSLGGRSNASGAASDAGQVFVTHGGAIKTSGEVASGVFAQSIGGGGGFGGRMSLDASGSWGSGAALGMGADSTTNGSGQQVNVDLIGGSVVTSGDDAMGVFAQSVGGGGGVQGEASSAVSGASIGSAGGKGVARSVIVSLDNASVTTSGQWAHGIFAQSASGSSGGTDETSRSLDVIVGCQAKADCSSSVNASGFGATGIIAQASGFESNVAGIFVRVDEGASVSGGSGSTSATGGTNAAIWVRDGASKQANIVRNSGTISNTDGAGGIAVKYTGSGGVTVDNFGTIVGGFSGSIADSVSGSMLVVGDETEPATEVINHAGGQLLIAGLSTFDQITNHGRIEVESPDPTALTHAGEQLVNKLGGTIALDLWDEEIDGLFNDVVSTLGFMDFELGSQVVIDAIDGFDPIVGLEFDLAFASDLRFETEAAADFDLFDYVVGSVFEEGLWDLSIVGGQSLPALPGMDLLASGFTGETLRLTYQGSPVPLPAAVWLFGSAALLLGGLGRRRGDARR